MLTRLVFLQANPVEGSDCEANHRHETRRYVAAR